MTPSTCCWETLLVVLKLSEGNILLTKQLKELIAFLEKFKDDGKDLIKLSDELAKAQNLIFKLKKEKSNQNQIEVNLIKNL